MNCNYSMSMALCVFFACASTSINANPHYQTVQTRQDAVNATYDAIIKKWKPVLTTVSEKNIFLVLKQIGLSLEQKSAATSNPHEREKIKALETNKDIWPIQFICQELDRDIQTIIKLQEEAIALSMPCAMDITQFRNIQVKIEQLPCFKREQADMASLAVTYRIYVAALVVGAIGYCIYKHTNQNPIVVAWDTLALSATTLYNYPSQK